MDLQETSRATGFRRAGSSRLWWWIACLAAPMAALWLLLARPETDLHIQHEAWHFWLVSLIALVNVTIGLRMGVAARDRGDARLVLVAMAFLASAGFLGLHALATPGVILPGPSGAFQLATPAGLLAAAVCAAASAVEWSLPPAAVRRLEVLVRSGLVVLLVAWMLVALARLPPLRDPVDLAPGAPPLLAFAVVTGGLYLGAGARYLAIHRRRPAAVLLAVCAAFALLAEAAVGVALSRNWQLSWWEWHLLMLAAFGVVAYSVRVQYVQEGSAARLFDPLSLDATVGRLRREYGQALEELVEGIRQQVETGGEPGEVARIAARVGRTFELTENQSDLLAESATALADERAQLARLGALVAVGREAAVVRTEEDLLERAMALVEPAFSRDRLRIALLTDGVARYVDDRTPVSAATSGVALRPGAEPVETGGALLLPLRVKGHPTGFLEVRRAGGGFAERERAVLASLASQLSIAVENARIYHQLDGLFRTYISPSVATALLADPDQAALGGASCEISVLFADLAGFTPFSERTEPTEVVSMLNRFYGVVAPVLLGEGGTITQFIGDAVMAVWNAPVRQPDHALRAGRAGLAMQTAVATVVAEHPGWPQFRVGINTGQAVVGNIGSAELRTYTACGDTVNLAARLESAAAPGEVLLGPSTAAQCRELAPAMRARPVGPLRVKGKAEPVQACVLLGLGEADQQ